MSADGVITQSSGAEAIRARIAEGLSAQAGRHAFSNRRRRFDIGFTERRRIAAMRRMVLLGFLIFVAIPGILAGGYFGGLADDRFVSETRFLLRVNQVAGSDRLGQVTGLPSLEMKRDTQVIATFLESAALVEALEARAGFRRAYEGPQPAALKPETWLANDWVARLEPDASAEDALDYWHDRSTVEIELPAGIVVLEVAAFSREEAQSLTAASLAEADALVNALNARVWAEAVEKAEALFRDSAERLATVQGRLAVARNEAGVFSAETEAGVLSELAGETRAELIRLEQDRAAKARHLSPTSAQMQALDRRIAALREQLTALGTERVAADPDGEALADVMARFSEIEVEQEIAERQFLAAAQKLEQVRRISEARMLYLDVFVEPTRPEDAIEPRRALAFTLWLTCGLIAWGIAVGLGSLMRNHMA
ncbi:MAG: hypothetical protein AAGC57_05365 [Pseudomonadota bacterium]